MYSFEKIVIIERPPAEVYNYVTNPENAANWQTGVEKAEWTSPSPYGSGSTWRVINKFLGKRIEAELEVLDWNPPKQITSKIVDGPLPFETTIKCEPEGNGTKLILNAKGEFGGFFKLAEGLVGKQAERQVESDLGNLKLLLESG